MTENMKKYLELLSKDEEAKKKAEELNKKLEEQMKRETIALAAESGIELTEKDFEKADELSEDELDAVAGGGGCFCTVGGGGTGDSSRQQDTCVCVLGGGGEYTRWDDGKKCARCTCVGFGNGSDRFKW